MAEGVTAVGNLVMTEGTKTKTQVIFTGNTVKAHSRVAFAGPGDNTVITDNVIDLMGEQYATGGRTSVIGLTGRDRQCGHHRERIPERQPGAGGGQRTEYAG